MARRRKRTRDDLRRRSASRRVLPRILAVCEGQTERSYILEFARDHRTNVDVEAVDLGMDPRTLVEEAARRRESAIAQATKSGDPNDTYDSVWSVFDVDQKPRERRIGEAKQVAKNNGINLSISNPCFELWALLHFEDYGKPSNQQQVQSRLRKFLPEYGRKKLIPFDRISDLYDLALRRATLLLRQREREGDLNGNPSTDVFKLTEMIQEFGIRYQLKKK